MREAAETADDVGVLERVFQPVVVARRAVEFDAALLVDRILGVHEREEEERALVRRQVLIVAALER